MSQSTTIDDLLSGLNPQQREAATHGDGPLLIVAGAGTGKTATLVHRVAWLIAGGVDPGRILLLTFTRRASAEMLRRAENLLRRLGRPAEKGIGPICRNGPEGAAHKLDLSPFRAVRPAFGAAPITPSPRGCCTASANPSACRRNSPSTTAAIPRTC